MIILLEFIFLFIEKSFILKDEFGFEKKLIVFWLLIFSFSGGFFLFIMGNLLLFLEVIGTFGVTIWIFSDSNFIELSLKTKLLLFMEGVFFK